MLLFVFRCGLTISEDGGLEERVRGILREFSDLISKLSINFNKFGNLFFDLECVINGVENLRNGCFNIRCVAQCYENTRERLPFILGEHDD